VFPSSGEAGETYVFGPLRNMCLLSLDVDRVVVDVRTETDPLSETLCSLAFRIQDDGQSPKTQ
jgi:hypothetical protein